MLGVPAKDITNDVLTLNVIYSHFYRCYMSYISDLALIWSPLALAPGLGPTIRLCKATSHPLISPLG